MNYTPRSVEGFRMVYGRAPTMAEFRAVINAASPPKPKQPENDGRYCGYCYDPECMVCFDEEGNVQ